MKPLRSLLTLVLFFPLFAFAAEYSFAVGEPNAEGVRDVAVLCESSQPINALEGKIVVGEGADTVSIRDAGSLVGLWIEHPEYHASKRSVTFSGIIPGGFVGRGILFHILLRGEVSALSIDTEASQTLLHDGMGTKENIALGAESVLLPEQALPETPTDDAVLPLPFTPLVAEIPTDNGVEKAIIFQARDDDSGIASYSVSYSDSLLNPEDPTLSWIPASSPHVIPADRIGSYIFVKATDHAGQSRVEVIPPGNTNTGSNNALLFVILGLVALGVALLVVYRRHIFHYAHSN